MTFLFSGTLSAEVTADIVEPLAGVAVRFYRPAGAGEESARAGRMLSGGDVAAKEGRWIGQVKTGADGRFSVDVSRQTILGGGVAGYDGGPLEIDVFAPGMPGVDGEGGSGTQFSLGVVQPDWSAGGEVRTAEVQLRVSVEVWGRIRAAMDAWVIAGRVLDRATGWPVAGARVSAYDADLVGDDPLGTGITDSEGRFRIDFRGVAFQDAALGSVLETTGPDLYFRVEDSAGGLLIAERRARAKRADRRDAGNVFVTDLFVEEFAGGS